MTEPSGDALLREAQKQAGELFLSGHLEKHALEQRAADEAAAAHADKHVAEQKAESTALEAERHRLLDHRIAHEAAHASHEKLHEAYDDAHKEQHASEQRAVDAAVKAMDRRLDSMNEFRDQLRDQAATFIRREQLEAFIAQYERAHDEVVQLIRTEREERRGNEATHALVHGNEEGQKKGISQSTAIIVGAIGLAATIITVVVVIINFLTATP